MVEFFNKPQHAISALEVWEELRVERLVKDYQLVLSELLENKQGFKSSREIFDDESLSWESRYEAFEEGEKELPSIEKIENYFYDVEFKKYLFQKMAAYIEKNMHQYAKIK
ncbi:hypothetical protein ACMA1I_13165 [Pontibacter sp. 13R65]